MGRKLELPVVKQRTRQTDLLRRRGRKLKKLLFGLRKVLRLVQVVKFCRSQTISKEN